MNSCLVINNKFMLDSQLQTKQELEKKLAELEIEHKELNDLIDNPTSTKEFSEFMLQRLKKRKLLIKDEIKALKLMLCPDLIA